MKVIERFFAESPFKHLQEHAEKVHKCVELIGPLTEALLAEDYEKIEDLHDVMSRTEHEADRIKTELRERISQMYFLSVGRLELSQYLAYQDDVADAAKDFAVLLLLRKTRLPEEIRKDFKAFVDQTISVSEHLFKLANKLSALAEAAFTGEQAQEMLDAIEKIGEEEWQADRLEHRFARHFYGIEQKLDPVTVMFLDKYCQALSAVSNSAERTAKYLRLIIRKK